MRFSLILLSSVSVVLAAGCTAPSATRGLAPRLPGPPVHARTPGFQPSVQASSAPVTPAPVNSVATDIAQVGYQDSACGSSACGCGACAVTPQGPTLPMGPQNTYGVDGQEFLCDGGDHPPEARVRRDDSIAGVQPEDTIVHYTTDAGEIEVKASNRVCLYAPRFKSVRKITGAVSGGRAIGLAKLNRQVGASNVEVNEGGVMIGESVELGHADVARSLDAMRDRNRGVPVEGILQVEQATDVLAALIGLTFDQISELRKDQKALLEELALAAVAWTVDESVEVAVEDLRAPTLIRDQRVEGLTIYEFPDAGRLQICKLADRPDARPGDIVNFAIRIENVGDSAVNQVAITDNLTTRLEYVQESQTCSAGAEFEAVPNEGASLQLTWKLTDKLRVGESATIRFRCRVR